MTSVDIIATLGAIALLLGCGFWFSRRGRSSMTAFVLGNRSLPWWLGGSAMVGTGSNVDSPLHQTGKVMRDGLAGAWFYWSQVGGQSFASLVFARLWRRTGLTTIIEFYHIRYSRRGGAITRIWSACYSSFIEGTLQVAIGLVAMLKLSTVLLGSPPPVELAGVVVPTETLILALGVVLALAYSTAAGLLGVVAGDLLEFVLAMAGSYALLFVVYRAVGGPSGLETGLANLGRSDAVRMTPTLGMALIAFFVIQPIGTACGSNTTNQRFLAFRDEREAMFAGIWRMLNHYFFRTWPWYLCGLAALVLLADRDVPRESAYAVLVRDYLPEGFRGVVAAGFVVAFMSSVGSLVHTSAAVFTNDLYRPFLVRERSERHYVAASRIAMLAFGSIGITIALASDHLLGLLQFFMKMVAAVGVVWLLRWFWWRVNAWADLAAQLGALPVALFYEHGPGRHWAASLSSAFGSPSPDDYFGASYLLSVGTTTALWLAVMYLTPPEPMEKLCEFYRRVRPYGWWRPVARLCPDVVITDRPLHDLAMAALLLGVSLCLLFGAGLALLARWLPAVSLLLLGAGLAACLVRRILRAAAPAA